MWSVQCEADNKLQEDVLHHNQDNSPYNIYNKKGQCHSSSVVAKNPIWGGSFSLISFCSGQMITDVSIVKVTEGHNIW